jgi:hypothetical protein
MPAFAGMTIMHDCRAFYVLYFGAIEKKKYFFHPPLKKGDTGGFFEA